MGKLGACARYAHRKVVPNSKLHLRAATPIASCVHEQAVPVGKLCLTASCIYEQLRL